LWGFTAPLVLLKPTYALLALVGSKRRSWWLGVGLVALLSALTLPLWPDYLTAMRNARFGQDTVAHVAAHLPLLLLPVVAWLGENTPPNRTGLRLTITLARRGRCRSPRKRAHDGNLVSPSTARSVVRH
jgi:hypothetical protein